MRLIVLGDIHGNIEAFKACVEDAINSYGSQISGFLLVGDYCCDFLEGNECVKLIRELEKKYPVYAIKGNREKDMVQKYYDARKNGEEVSWSVDTTMGSPLLSCQRMTDDELKYLSELPDDLLINLDGVEPLYLQHKMPLSEDTIKELRKRNVKNIITAHTHEAHSDEYGEFRLFNPGSVGLTDSGKPGAEYAVLTWKNNHWIIEQKHIDYDYQAQIEHVRSNQDLMNKCKYWGQVLIASIETGLNVTALYMFEKNRIAEMEAKKLSSESAGLDFGIGRYANVSPTNDYLTSRIIVAGPEESNIKKLKYNTDQFKEKGSRYSETDEMYERALNNVLAYLKKLQESNGLEGCVSRGRKF